MSVYSTMYDEAQNHFAEIGKMELGSDEHVKTVECANSMVDRLNERDRIANEDRQLELKEREIELEYARIESEKRGRRNTTVLTLITFAGYAGLQVWTLLSDREFEAKGLMNTSEAGRTSKRNLLNLVDKLLKK